MLSVISPHGPSVRQNALFVDYRNGIASLRVGARAQPITFEMVLVVDGCYTTSPFL